MTKTLIKLLAVAGIVISSQAWAADNYECTTTESGYTNLNTKQTTVTPIKNSLIYFVNIDRGVVSSYYPATNQKTVYDQTRLVSSTVTGSTKTMVFEGGDNSRVVRATLTIDLNQPKGAGYTRAGFSGQTQGIGNPGVVFSRGSCIL